MSSSKPESRHLPLFVERREPSCRSTLHFVSCFRERIKRACITRSRRLPFHCLVLWCSLVHRMWIWESKSRWRHSRERRCVTRPTKSRESIYKCPIIRLVCFCFEFGHIQRSICIIARQLRIQVKTEPVVPTREVLEHTIEIRERILSGRSRE